MQLRIVLLGVMLLAISASLGLLWPPPASVVHELDRDGEGRFPIRQTHSARHNGSESNASDPSQLRSASVPTPQPVELEEQSRRAAIPAEEQTRWLEDSPQVEALLHRFISETQRDPGWATRVESRIFEAIADSPRRPGFSAIHIDCRTTMCRIELNLAGQVYGNRPRPLPPILAGALYGTQFMDKLSEAGEFDVVLYSARPDDSGTPMVVFYLEHE